MCYVLCQKSICLFKCVPIYLSVSCLSTWLSLSSDGYNIWRDAKKPSAILAELCRKNSIQSPEYRTSEVKVLNKIFKIPPDAVPEGRTDRHTDKQTGWPIQTQKWKWTVHHCLSLTHIMNHYTIIQQFCCCCCCRKVCWRRTSGLQRKRQRWRSMQPWVCCSAGGRWTSSSLEPFLWSQSTLRSGPCWTRTNLDCHR